MNFIEAVKKMQNGERVRLPHWVIDVYGKKQNCEYAIFDGKWDFKWCFSENEMLSNDWEIYQEQPKLHTFEEPLAALKNGAKIYRTHAHHNHKKTDKEFLFYDYEDFEANDWIIDWIIEG
jgi:hypothetical protein